jgi:predicted metal-dependent hydrolase
VSRAREEALDAYLACYEAGRWFDAHEALERAWRRSPDPEMMLIQGLIQWAVALEHHRRGNPHGALTLLDRAWAKIEPAPSRALGLDLDPLRAAQPSLRRALARWRPGEPPPPIAVPRIARAAPLRGS